MADAARQGSEAGKPAQSFVSEGRDGLPLAVVQRGNAEGSEVALPLLRRVLWKIRFLPLVMLLLMTGGVIGLYFQPPGLKLLFSWLKLTPGGGTSSPIAVPVARKPPPIAESERRRFVAGLGKLLPAGDVLMIAPPYGAGDARIAELKVAEGDRVRKGQLLVVLDNEQALQAIVESARATVAAREAAVAQALNQVRASRSEARAALERAEATSRNAQAELQRVEALFSKGISSEASYLQKRTIRDEAAREVEKARATLSRWEGYEPEQHPDVVLARRNLDAAKSELARALSDLERAHVNAPIDGTVLTLHVRPGEKPGSKGIMNLGNIDRMTVEIEVYQTQIAAVSVGDAVEITAEALPGPLKAVVTRIGLEVGRQVLTDPNPAANTDARVVKVYAELEPESSQIARRFTNLQVLARISVKSQP